MNIKSISVSIALIVLVYFASSTKAQFATPAANSQMEAYSFFQESILPILPENMQKMARSYVEEASDRSLEVAQANLLKVWPLIMVDGSTYYLCIYCGVFGRIICSTKSFLVMNVVFKEPVTLQGANYPSKQGSLLKGIATIGGFEIFGSENVRV